MPVRAPGRSVACRAPRRGGQLGGHVGDQAPDAVGGDEHRRAGVGQHVPQLRGGEAGVDRHGDQPGAEGAEPGDHEVRRVGQRDGDAWRRTAGVGGRRGGGQAAGGGVHRGVQFGPAHVCSRQCSAGRSARSRAARRTRSARFGAGLSECVLHGDRVWHSGRRRATPDGRGRARRGDTATVPCTGLSGVPPAIRSGPVDGTCDAAHGQFGRPRTPGGRGGSAERVVKPPTWGSILEHPARRKVNRTRRTTGPPPVRRSGKYFRLV